MSRLKVDTAECNTPLYGECIEESDENSNVIFKMKMKRKIAQTELLNMKALKYYRNAADATMDFHDPEPAHLPDLEVLRKARQEGRNRKMGINSAISMWKTLQTLKGTVEQKKYIKEIGFDRAHVFYWSPHQISLCNNVQKNFRTLISINATGSVVRKISRPNNDGSAIFLYVITRYIPNRSDRSSAKCRKEEEYKQHCISSRSNAFREAGCQFHYILA